MSVHVVSKQLNELQARLMETVNRLWAIRLSLSSAYRQGFGAEDFLPRRLRTFEQEEEMKFGTLLQQVNFLISTQLDSTLIPLSSEEDVKTVTDLKRTIRYIRNAFGVATNSHH